MHAVHLNLMVDTKQAKTDIAELNWRMEVAPDWLRWLVAEAFRGCEGVIELTEVDGDRRAAALAGEVWIGAKLTERHRLLLSALRASQGDRECGVFFEVDLEHGGSHA